MTFAGGMGRQTVWITRAQPGAAATAERLAARGHQPLVLPLLEVRPIPGVQVDLSGVAALAFTSGNGVRAFADLCQDRSLQVFTVGAATAQAAREAGFRRVLSADGDVAQLGARIAARRREIRGTVLNPGALEPAGDLTGALLAGGLEARALPLYDTVPTQVSADELASVRQADAVLLHSPKAAKILAGLLKGDILAPDVRLLGLSKAVLKPLARSKIGRRDSPPFPLEAALLNLVDRTP